MTVKERPTIHALVVADQVFPQASGKWCIIGTFQGIAATQFPCQHPQLGIYLSLSNAKGEYAVELQILDPDEHPQHKISGKFISHDPLRLTEVGLNIANVAFPRPGEYRIRILIDGEEAAYDARIKLDRLAPPQAPQKPPFAAN